MDNASSLGLSSQGLQRIIALVAVLLAGRARAAEEVRFGRDVLPILSDRCFHCHGPDETHREAELRLDLRDAATADRGGYAVISPGKPDESELIKRITSEDADARMPPIDSHRKPLTPREIDILRHWITSGAQWGRHWSFEKPERPTITGATANPIDALVLRRLKEEGLHPSPEAAKRTLIRRVSFDLTGVPPSVDEVEAFVADSSPDAYEKLVDRLLASPAYGERMAMWWLDAARYSDTDGFQHDDTRTNWPWRDWVVQAFNRNMRFDEFTIDQFAGDLLPNATSEQILSTCFHRNHMTNGEGGRDPEESRIDYVIDRVNTMGTVWLGLTLGCCQCHSHKFDPITQKDYYGLSAFFNSIDEDGKAGDKATPYLDYKSAYAERAVDEAQHLVDARKRVEVAAREKALHEFEPWLSQQIDDVRLGFRPWHALQALSLESVEGATLTQGADRIVHATGKQPVQDDYRFIVSAGTSPVTGLRLEVFPETSGSGSASEFILTDVKLQVQRKGQALIRDIEIAGAIADAEENPKKSKDDNDDYGKVKDTLDDDPRNGWTVESRDRDKPHFAIYALAQPLRLAEDEQLVFTMLHRSTRGYANIRNFRVSTTDQPGEIVLSLQSMPLETLASAKVERSADVQPALQDRLLDQFLADHPAYQQAKSALVRAERQLTEVKQAGGKLHVMVLKERKMPRHTYVLERGTWDNKGEEVSCTVPGAILAWPAEKTKTRLDLAQWLVSKDNPLTARVIANQLWQMCFGAGLVRTPEDFGLQGEPPTNPELLDWLACELMDSHWDLKHVLRLIVTSRIYRQSSDVSPALLERDPENRLLARGARFRLPSWMIRDAALRTSGLLNPALGGPPVMPYQPEGVWEEMFMGRFRYEPSQGPAQFRRTLYAFWRRAVAPTFLFDSAQRRYCEVRSQRTNTPLQALTLLNDVSMLEASRALARDVITKKPDSTSRLALIFRSVLSRSPTATEANVLSRELGQALKHYQQAPDDAIAFLDFGQPENRSAEKPAELAAYMVVASMVFNLDEAMTHE